MIPAITAALAVFVLVAGGVCALASARRVALTAVAVALTLAFAASAAALVGQHRYETCLDRATQLEPDPPTEDQLLAEEYTETARERQAGRYVTALDSCPQSGAYGLRDPF